jgi:hypothetical protein
VFALASCGSSGFSGRDTDELTLNFMGFTGEGIEQADLVGTTTADVDVCPTICSIQIDEFFVITTEFEEFTSTRAFALFQNVGFADILLSRYVVSNPPESGLPDRTVETAVLIPGGRCSNSPSTHCGDDSDCGGLGGCVQSATPIEILLFDFIDKALLQGEGTCPQLDPDNPGLIIPGTVVPQRYQTNVTFFASDESGEEFQINAGLSGQFSDFNNCQDTSGGGGE